MQKLFALALILIAHCLQAAPTPLKLNALYHSLSPNSISENLAFYTLYPDTQEGKEALKNTLELLSNPLGMPTPEPTQQIANALRALIHKQPMQEIPEIQENELQTIFQLGKKLGNRKLRGYYVKTNAEVLSLPLEEIDLARGLFLSQLGEEALHKIFVYEAILDLMALQILADLKTLEADPKEKVEAINRFIFEEMGFRFPPHSRYAKDIDLYTFLPSVLDSRRGVCLGVSILYIAIAQRLNLALEMITPPGHIYVRYKDDKREINIETTARGVHVDSEEYLGINTRSLQKRAIKEVIGLAHFNQASQYWQKGENQKAIDAYLTAQKYLPDDYLLKELLAYNYFIVGNTQKALPLLQEVQDHLPDYAIYKDSMAKEILDGLADREAILAITSEVDETRRSLVKKKEELEKVIEKFPRFKTAHFQLATTWLQLHREKEALVRLKKVHELDANDPTAEYYLSVLFFERLDYNNSWKHLKIAEKLLKARSHESKVLKELKKELVKVSPEPKNKENIL